MTSDRAIMPRRYRALGPAQLEQLGSQKRLDPDVLIDLRAVASVLPFRVNPYVLEELIDWDDVPRDPIFQMTFPQEGMLKPSDLRRLRDLLHRGASQDRIREVAREVQRHMNPHPAGQLELNVPRLSGEPVSGVQHKYRETVLFFPGAGQTCHAYCTYCFRWAQFVGLGDLQFAAREVDTLVRYLSAHPEVTDVLITGGDPLIMRTAALRRVITPILDVESVRTIRIGTKAPAYWPHRFVSDSDADELMELLSNVVQGGRHLALMAHYSHPRELAPPVAREAVRRILSTGAVIRCQAPVIRHVNDSAAVWADLWRAQVQLGAIPYYMFVERDTGPRDYFEVPLARALQIYQDAFERVSGLARTARGPSMSATPGKVLIDGITEIDGRRLFVLRFLQARDPRWTRRVFFAEFDPEATWLDDLRPGFGAERFFFEQKVHGFVGRRSRERVPRRRVWGADPRSSDTLSGSVDGAADTGRGIHRRGR